MRIRRNRFSARASKVLATKHWYSSRRRNRVPRQSLEKMFLYQIFPHKQGLARLKWRSPASMLHYASVWLVTHRELHSHFSIASKTLEWMSNGSLSHCVMHSCKSETTLSTVATLKGTRSISHHASHDFNCISALLGEQFGSRALTEKHKRNISRVLSLFPFPISRNTIKTL